MNLFQRNFEAVLLNVAQCHFEAVLIIVVQCHFEGEERDCAEIFLPVITDDGQ